MHFQDLPGVVMLRERTAGVPQHVIAAKLGCTQAFISYVLAGKQRLGVAYRAKARESYGVPVEAWLTADELPPDDANDASHLETPHRTRRHGGPAPRCARGRRAASGGAHAPGARPRCAERLVSAPSVGDRIRAARKAKGLSLADVGARRP